MSPPPIPRVRLPDPNTTPSRPLIPGPNSWAQSSRTDLSSQDIPKLADVAGTRPSNRGEYEVENSSSNMATDAANRAEYELDNDNSSDHPRDLKVSKQRTHNLQPATPLLLHTPSQTQQRGRSQTNAKDRAVTGPVTPAPLSVIKYKRSVSNLRAGKFSHQETVPEEEDTVPDTPVSQQQHLSPLPESRGSTPRPLGVYPISKDKRTNYVAPASAPPSTAAPDPYCESSEEDYPVRMTRSTPVPTRRWMRENGIPTPPQEIARALERLSNEETNDGHSVSQQPGGMVLGDGKLSPTRDGTYGRAVNVKIVDGLASVRSQAGSFVEGDAEEDKAIDKLEEQSDTKLGTDSQTTGVALPAEAEVLRPMAYSPSIYGGVWENDPAVGHSLPPFSPNESTENPHYSIMSNPYQPEMQMRGVSNASGVTIPMVFRGRPSEITPVSHSFGSANSWASSRVNSGNNHAQHNTYTSAADPALFSENNNFVPPAPHAHPDFPPSTGPPPPSLARMEDTLHHHMDAVYERLSRLVVDKNDRVLDEVIRRCSALEEKVDKGPRFGITRTDLRDIKNDLGTLKGDTKNIGKTVNELRRTMKNLEKNSDERFSGLEQRVEDVNYQHEYSARGESRGGYGIQEEYATPSNTSPQRAGYSGYTGSPRRGRSNRSVNHTPHANRNNNSTGHGRRRSDWGSGTEGRPSVDGEDRRERFAQMGATMGPAPDLREHPAYQSAHQHHDSGSHGQTGTDMPAALASGAMNVLYQVPQYTEADWYHRTYDA